MPGVEANGWAAAMAAVRSDDDDDDDDEVGDDEVGDDEAGDKDEVFGEEVAVGDETRSLTMATRNSCGFNHRSNKYDKQTGKV